MSLTPKLVRRDVQPYVATRARVARSELAQTVPPLLSEVYAWLGARGVRAIDAPLIRYLVVDYNDGTVEVDVGAPVTAGVCRSEGRVQVGEIPGGLYATVVHRGPYATLVETTAKLLEWGKENAVAWQVDDDSKVTTWRGRIERYLVGPESERDERNWETEIAILLAARLAETAGD